MQFACRERDLAVLAWRGVEEDRSEDGNGFLCGVRSLSLPSQTCGRLGRVSKSPEREATQQRYHGRPLLIYGANGNPTASSALAGRQALYEIYGMSSCCRSGLDQTGLCMGSSMSPGSLVGALRSSVLSV